MKLKRDRIYNVLIILVLIGMAATSFTGCNKKNSALMQGNDDEAYKNAEYPIKTDQTLTYWVSLNSNVSATTTNLGDTALAKELTEKTGIKVEYIHPPLGQEKEQFNLMIASSELPDIIESNWSSFQGGPDQAINQNIIMPLDDLIENYSPNFKNYINDDSKAGIKRLLLTSGGNYYLFPFLIEDDFLRTYYGPIMRKDWLDELGLDIPRTIDDWEAVLREFKQKKNSEAPLSMPNNLSLHNGIVGAYGIADGFYLEDGKVKYGPLEKEYKEFLTTFNRWFQEGILDKNFGNIDTKILDSNILGGKTGATFGALGGGIGKWTTAYSGDGAFELIGVPYPTLQEGQKPMFGQKHQYFIGIGSAITTKCKSPALAAKFLDFAYTDEGHMIYNFGVKGESYNIIGGYPTYTDLIVKNPEGLPIGHSMAKYIRANYSGPFIQDRRYMEQYLATPQQKNAIETWMNTDADKYLLPLLSHTQEENIELANIMLDIETHKEETALKFIIGVNSLDKFDSFVEQLKNMGIERAIEIKQKAFERHYEN